MDTLFSKILYQNDTKRFEQIRETAAGFSSVYIGDNIIQDDIFTVIENYAKTKLMPLEWLRFPIQDEELCACTFVRGGRIFVLLNSGIPTSKQIFAAAHELYHIRRFLEENDSDLAESGSILEAKTIDAGTTEQEELEANAFAGLLLAPADALEKQIKIYQIDKSSITIDDVLTLMELFAIPYKALVLRLFEESMITDAETEKLLNVSSNTINEQIKTTGKAKRWERIPLGSEKLGSLYENLTVNTENEALPKSRLDGDWERLRAIMKQYGIE